MSKKPATELTAEVVALLDKTLVDRAEAARVLPIKDVARLMGVSASTVRRLIDDGKLPSTRIGNRLGVSQKHVLAHIEKHTYAAQEQSAAS